MRARLTAAQALESPWVREGGCAPETPLEGTVVQRLQRHATYGHLKQLARAPSYLGAQGFRGLARGFVGGIRPEVGTAVQRLQHHATCRLPQSGWRRPASVVRVQGMC